MSNKTYEDGIVQGQLETLERMATEHKDRLDYHARRLRLLERSYWMMLGVVIIAQIWPQLRWVFQING